LVQSCYQFFCWIICSTFLFYSHLCICQEKEKLSVIFKYKKLRFLRPDFLSTFKFCFQERPKWMQISSLDELKTKVGHVIVMILLVKMFERSKMVVITTGLDLLNYSVCIFLSSASLYVLHNLHKEWCTQFLYIKGFHRETLKCIYPSDAGWELYS